MRHFENCFLGQQGDSFLEVVLRGSPEFVDLGSTLVKVESGHGFNGALGSNVGSCINVNLHEGDIGVFGSKFLKEWGDGLAWRKRGKEMRKRERGRDSRKKEEIVERRKR